MKLSLVLATYNEASNIRYPLDSCINWVDEVVVIDGGSTDKTVKIARSYGKKVHVIIRNNPKMFHINKQKALDVAKGDWILQLDADEAVSDKLSKEIKQIVKMSQKELKKYENSLEKKKLFLHHQKILEERDGKIGNKGEQYVAFFIPRQNYFLGKFLKHGGVYPDGVIRLVKKGKARFPCKDVHEVMEVNGRVGWLNNDLLHYDSPTFKRYIEKNNRYIDFLVDQMKERKLKKDTIRQFEYLILRPIYWFLMTTIRHKGLLDGWQGILFSFYSALRFPKAYLRYFKLPL